MSAVEHFLEAAVRLERDSALRYDELADAIAGHGRAEVVAFFRRQALFSRRHQQQAESRIGRREAWEGVAAEPDADPGLIAFPGGDSPEAAALWAADGHLSEDGAMALALAAEEAGRAYYAKVAATATDPEIRRLAADFAQEEAEHVQALKDLIAKFATA